MRDDILYYSEKLEKLSNGDDEHRAYLMDMGIKALRSVYINELSKDFQDEQHIDPFRRADKIYIYIFMQLQAVFFPHHLQVLPLLHFCNRDRIQSLDGCKA